MASYQIDWKSSAQKELRKLPSDMMQKIVTVIESLGKNYSHPVAANWSVLNKHGVSASATIA